MKTALTKIFAVLGMLCTLVCVFYLIRMAIFLYFPDLLDDGTPFYEPENSGFHSGLFALIVSVFSMVFYVVDAIICVLKAILKKDAKFNLVLAAVLLISAAFGVVVITNYLKPYTVIPWFICFFAVFALEVVSIVRCFKKKS